MEKTIISSLYERLMYISVQVLGHEVEKIEKEVSYNNKEYTKHHRGLAWQIEAPLFGSAKSRAPFLFCGTDTSLIFGQKIRNQLLSRGF